MPITQDPPKPRARDADKIGDALGCLAKVGLMIAPPQSSDESNRLQALDRMNILDTPLDERFERITRLAQHVFRVPLAALSLVDADRQWFKSIQGLPVTETPRSVSFCGHAILQDEVMVVPDARKDERFMDNPLVKGAPHIVFYAGCPVHAADGSRVGTLCITDRRPRALSAEDLEVLRDLAAIAEKELSESMQDSFVQDLLGQLNEMQRKSQLDALTRLWNRESIFDLLAAELARAQRASRGIGVIMADLDHFKTVNDTYGHAAGDEVLCQTARRILGSIRADDALGRYGGEEFLVVLGACDGVAGARAVAERIRGRIGNNPFATDFGGIQMSISVGVAYFESAGAASSELLAAAADRALYCAKHGGRNRVESISTPSGPGPDAVLIAGTADGDL